MVVFICYKFILLLFFWKSTMTYAFLVQCPNIKSHIFCRGLVVLMHGLNEHRFVYVPNGPFGSHFLLILLFDYYITIPLFTNSGRYNDFAKELNANGFKVYGMDWIGKFEILHGCLDFSFLMRQNNLSVLAWYHYLAYW